MGQFRGFLLEQVKGDVAKMRKAFIDGSIDESLHKKLMLDDSM